MEEKQTVFQELRTTYKTARSIYYGSEVGAEQIYCPSEQFTAEEKREDLKRLQKNLNLVAFRDRRNQRMFKTQIKEGALYIWRVR